MLKNFLLIPKFFSNSKSRINLLKPSLTRNVCTLAHITSMKHSDHKSTPKSLHRLKTEKKNLELELNRLSGRGVLTRQQSIDQVKIYGKEIKAVSAKLKEIEAEIEHRTNQSIKQKLIDSSPSHDSNLSTTNMPVNRSNPNSRSNSPTNSTTSVATSAHNISTTSDSNLGPGAVGGTAQPTLTPTTLFLNPQVFGTAGGVPLTMPPSQSNEKAEISLLKRKLEDLKRSFQEKLSKASAEKDHINKLYNQKCYEENLWKNQPPPTFVNPPQPPTAMKNTGTIPKNPLTKPPNVEYSDQSKPQNDLLDVSNMLDALLSDENQRNNMPENSAGFLGPAQIKSDRDESKIRNSFVRRLRSIPVFEGDSFKSLRDFLEITQALNESWETEAEKTELLEQINLQLRGEARKAVGNIFTLEYQEMKKRLLKYFSHLTNKNIVTSQLENLRQEKKESMSDYAERARKLLREKCSLYDELPKEQKDDYIRLAKKAFINGISDNKTKTRLQIRDASSLEDAIAYAIESENDTTFSVPNTELYCRFCKSNGHRERDCTRKESNISDVSRILNLIRGNNGRNVTGRWARSFPINRSNRPLNRSWSNGQRSFNIRNQVTNQRNGNRNGSNRNQRSWQNNGQSQNQRNFPRNRQNQESQNNTGNFAIQSSPATLNPNSSHSSESEN